MDSKFKINCTEGFRAEYEIKEENDKTFIEISAFSEKADKLNLWLTWFEEATATGATFSPTGHIGRTIVPDWGGWNYHHACGSAPFYSSVDYNDKNNLAIACQDALNYVGIQLGLEEETCRFKCGVHVRIDYDIKEYKTVVLIDKRPLPFYQVAQEVSKWWEMTPGYEPTNVPEDTREPFYSTWYSFHQHTDAEEILKELEKAKNYGCKGVIVDDGWQTDSNSRGYDYCGDWEPFTGKIPDMKAFVDGVHKLGMKILLWYGVPMMGKKAKNIKKFEGKFIAGNVESGGTFDPRYPEVREYLKNIYVKAQKEWGLDGFKLDFVDSFHSNYPNIEKASFAPGKDCDSIYVGVDKLLKDVLTTLKEVNPDIMIEFRQSYIGPLMRTYGNIFRAADCPADSRVNRLDILTLRIFSGKTTIQSDMIMWNVNDTAENAAFQFTNILFAVPQISMRWDALPESHQKMLKFYVDFWKKHKTTLLDGEMFYKDYHAGFNFASAWDENCQVGAIYGSELGYINKKSKEINIVNATMNEEIYVKNCAGEIKGTYKILNCMGDTVEDGNIILKNGINSFNIPVNGILVISGDN
ncbi:MAG: alpha-galactosidase [Ruminococcaceae bacterium]|nr:alpha-galactosidase [Oscillospiraceae bacterium]